jgi:cupin 2 domain-containing protein
LIATESLPEPSIMPNLFEFPSSLPEQEVFDPLLHHPNVCIERIISTGQITPPGEWYDQNQDEWVILIQGQAELAYDDGSRLPVNYPD